MNKSKRETFKKKLQSPKLITQRYHKSKCDLCNHVGDGIEYYQYGTPVLFVCTNCA